MLAIAQRFTRLAGIAARQKIAKLDGKLTEHINNGHVEAAIAVRDVPARESTVQLDYR